ncbi:ENTH domain-containing protein 1 isoform X1 [Equus asinus]|uniref:ENTH domain containing 1 n=2 Tax=Equus asinus TaxID=9793 RepID=A0A8C4L5Z0_EQUAS|nr:ENTH domain-containing protein 1 isoform X2 [Equus asinus]XP_014714439.1 ENTH domain-containing protein 1 isoform X2 [Equus asinus]XP_044635411.1 ENTH domain-containing protein 1 isoform X2 [Equus asinus]
MAFRRQVKNFVKNYSDAEIKVREATSNDPWGPSSSLMLDISDLTFNTISLSEIMNMLWQRLKDHGKNWRHVYKSLTLMDYLIKNGSRKVIQHCREGFCNLQTLKDFQHVDEAGKDQGYYIREKSKQVITLLMDEQLLHKEREIACRTRRRTSYSMTFPKRVPGTGNSPTACASAPTPEIPASERKHKLLKVARLCNKKNASKAGLKQQQCQDAQLPSGTALSQETLPFKINAWKSTEDLMLFCEDDPQPLLPAIPPAILSPTTWLSEGQADICHLWDADAVSPPSFVLSEKSPSLQTNVSLDKKSESTITNTVIENPLQTPLEKQSAAKSFETLTTLPAFWPSNQEELISPNLRLSKSDSTFYNQASVETLYVSPSFNVFDPVKEMVINKDCQKPAESSVVQMEEENLKTLTAWVSTASEGTSSFSTLSMSSPDSASPGKSVHLLPPILARPSFWTLSHQTSSSASFKDKDKTTSAHHPFAPGGPVSSDEEENDNLNLLEILPDNSDSAQKKSHISSSNWVEFSTQNVDPFTSMSCSGFQTSKGRPREPEAKNSIKGLLGEVKNAIVKLHEDLSMVIQELNVINSHLVSMGGASPQISRSLQLPQSSEGGSDPV